MSEEQPNKQVEPDDPEAAAPVVWVPVFVYVGEEEQKQDPERWDGLG